MSSSNTDDEIRKLLAKAKALREEAALMSGKTIEEMERERREMKEAERERAEANEAARSTREADAANNGSSRSRKSDSRVMPVPENAAAQVQQAASAIERAFADGLVRQTVRLALLTKDEPMSDDPNEWPGGSRQMYREAGRPLAESLLREVRAHAAAKEEDASSPSSSSSSDTSSPNSRTPPEVTAEDIWDFDGSAAFYARSASGPRGDVRAVVFPNTDTKYLKDIESISGEVGPDRLLLLVNPFWKDVESWGFNILAPNGKRRAQEVIFDRGYDVTYAVLRFSARGEDVLALKSYPYDWQLYAYREDPSWFNRKVPIWLGSSKEEPSYSQFSELLNGRPEFKMNKNMRQMQRMMGNDDQ